MEILLEGMLRRERTARVNVSLAPRSLLMLSIRLRQSTLIVLSSFLQQWYKKLEHQSCTGPKTYGWYDPRYLLNIRLRLLKSPTLFRMSSLSMTPDPQSYKFKSKRPLSVARTYTIINSSAMVTFKSASHCHLDTSRQAWCTLWDHKYKISGSEIEWL